MPKRKREDDEQNIDRIKNQAVRIKASRLKARFDQGVLQLTQALKLARGFDRQKMTRRIAQAGTDDSKLERLNAEVEILNALQEPKVARKYLLKQFVRTKRIAESEGFVALFGGVDKVQAVLKKGGSIGVVEGNVLGRLMKSGPVNDVLPSIMKGIRDVVGADKSKTTNGVERTNDPSSTKRPKLDTEVRGEDGEDEFNGFSDDDILGRNSSIHELTNSTRNVSMDEEDKTPEVPDEDLMEAYDDRLAASSDSDSDSDNALERKGQSHDRLDDMEITSDEDISGEDDGVNAELYESDASDASDEHPNTSLISKAPPKATSTSFLPTLMHGGYYSGSEDESDGNDGQDYDPDKSFAAVAQPRKNRRGQRERQLIAEKKYGNKAKHLLKANGTENVHGARQALINGGARRDDGWDARKGAVGTADRSKGRGVERTQGDDRRSTRTPNRFERRNGVAREKVRRGLGARGVGTGAGRSTGANSMAVNRDQRPKAENSARKAGTEKLHPSWEAARKRKIESATVGANSFAGKKITFD